MIALNREPTSHLDLPEISVIIITLNEEHTLPILLKQLAEQSYQNFQLIISDSNSTDATKEVANAFNYLGNSFLFHNCGVTKGPGYGRNQGALLAKHEIILFLDADTGLPHKHFLEDTLRYYLEHQLDVAGCYIQPSTDKIIHKIGCEIINFIMRGYEKNFPIVPGAYIISKKYWHTLVSGFDETITLGEDSRYVKTCQEAGAKFGRLPYKFICDTRRVEKKGIWHTVKTYRKGFLITAVYKQKIRAEKAQTVDYEFGIYK